MIVRTVATLATSLPKPQLVGGGIRAITRRRSILGHESYQAVRMSSHEAAPHCLTSLFNEQWRTENPRAPNSPTRIGLVLSGGGLRGAGHIGVLQQLIAHNISIDVIVGSSAGAIVAAYYAAVGLTIDELVRDARHFRGRHLIAHSLNLRLDHHLDRVLGRLSGLIPSRLEQLERATFDRLHHGIRAVGIVCHDLKSGQPRYFATGHDQGVRLSEAVRASAAMPFLFPPAAVRCAGEDLLLTDGGLSDCLPIGFAKRPPLSATHLIVSDCRWFATHRPESTEHGDVIYVRPRLLATGTLWAPSSTLLDAVRQGAAAITDDVLARIAGWRSVLVGG
jgi:predicted acylesterase/phospholipase RssA